MKMAMAMLMTMKDDDDDVIACLMKQGLEDREVPVSVPHNTKFTMFMMNVVMISSVKIQVKKLIEFHQNLSVGNIHSAITKHNNITIHFEFQEIRNSSHFKPARSTVESLTLDCCVYVYLELNVMPILI